MFAEVLVPGPCNLHVVRCVRRRGPPSISIDGLARTAADRIRAAITNSGFAVPAGHIDVTLDPGGEAGPEADLALALAMLLCDPTHEHMQRSGLVARGELALDGS
jgi:predicted ATPase with chaperone activity